jgi:transposase
MIQLAWSFLNFQKDSALAQWCRIRAADGRSGTRKTMIVALARKLLIALWRVATTGEFCAPGQTTTHLWGFEATTLGPNADPRWWLSPSPRMVPPPWSLALDAHSS